MLRISILAQSLKIAGGRAVGTNFLAALARVAPQHAYHLFVPTGVGYEDVVTAFPNARPVFIGPMSFTRRWRFDRRELPELVRAGRPDVVFGLQGFGLADPPAPQVLFPQDAHLFYPERHYAGELWTARLNKYYNRRRLARHLRRTKLILCQTAVVEQRIRSAFGYEGDAWVCGSAVAPTLAAQTAPPLPAELEPFRDRFKLLCLSKYSVHKNFEGIIEAVQAGGERLGDITVVTTVAPEPHPHGRRFIERLGGLPPGRIVNVGNVSPERVAGFYAHAEGLLMPTRLETFCLPYVEAMSFGRPILTSDLDFAHEVCGDAATYFDAWNSTAMAEAMIRFRGDAALRRELADNARARVATLFQSWDQIAAGAIARIESLAGGSGR